MSGKRINVETYEVIQTIGGFSFITDNGFCYEVEFLLSNPYGEKKDYSDNLYSFSFSTSTDKTINDVRTSQTIISILLDFMNNTDNIIYFLCDISNNKHHARNVLFEKWFKTHKTKELIKINSQITLNDSDDCYFVSLIYNENNIHKLAIEKDFYDSIDSLSNK